MLSLDFVNFFQYFNYASLTISFTHEAAEVIISYNSGYSFKCGKMCTSRIIRGKQQKEEMNWFTIKGIEINALNGSCNCTYNLFYTIMFCVWNSNTFTNTSTSQFLPFHKCFNNILKIFITDFLCFLKCIHHFSYDCLFFCSFELYYDSIFYYTIS